MQGWNNWLKEASAGSRLRPHTHAHLIVIPWGVLPDRARHLTPDTFSAVKIATGDYTIWCD
jgi:hypothetical protein